MWTKGGCGPKAIPIEGAWLKLYRISKESGFWDLALENPAIGSSIAFAMLLGTAEQILRALRRGSDIAYNLI